MNTQAIVDAIGRGIDTLIGKGEIGVLTNILNALAPAIAPLYTSVDDTPTGTTYYPDVAGYTIPDGYSNISVIGLLVIGVNTITVTFEGSNDGTTWVQLYGYDTKNDDLVNSQVVANSTLTFAMDFDDYNYKLFRIKTVVSAGAATTCQLTSRIKA